MANVNPDGFSESTGLITAYSIAEGDTNLSTGASYPIPLDTFPPSITTVNPDGSSEPSFNHEKLIGSRAPRPGDFVYDADLDTVKRQLGSRQIQMIALAGTIGTGLFLGLGQVLSACGPLGSLIVYIHVCTVIYSTILSIGELTAFAPISGSLLLYAGRWLDPAMGFALGWNYFYYAGTAIPLEITAFTSMVSFWDPNPNHTPIYIVVIIVTLLLFNLFGTRLFGNSEIVFSSLKIMLAVSLIIGGLVISLGGGPDHKVIGFEYWKNPGPLVSTLEPGALGRFLGLLVAISPAAFSVSGIELISIAAAETKKPRTNIIRAMKTVIFRLVFFFLLSVLVVGMLVPSNDPALLQPGESAGQSPFVIAFQRAGVKVLPSIINAVLITSALSATNTFLFSASRILYGLAVQKKAPKILTTCTKDGLPWVAVIASWLFSFLSFLTLSTSSGTVFSWFVSLAAVCGFLGWITMNVTYLRYYYGMKRQGIVRPGIYRSPLQPYAAIWAVIWVSFYTLVSGISVFWEWNTSQFIASYINLPVFFGLFVGYKLWYKTKMLPLDELDFVTNIPTLEETGDEDLLLEKKSFATKLRELV